MKLRELADFVMRPRLLTIPGVAQVIPIGGEVRQYRVVPDPRKMATLDVGLEAIEKAVKSFGANTSGGFVDLHAREYPDPQHRRARSRSRTSPTWWCSIGTASPSGSSRWPTVEFAARTKRGDAGYRGKPAVVLGIQKQPGADTVTLTREIERALPELQKVMPKGVQVENVQFRQATFIERSIANVSRVLLEALAVVAIVLFLFLLNWQTTFISITAIPISIAVTVIVFQLLGLSINTMTLGGLAIAIGALVDDAVVGRGEHPAAAAPQPRRTEPEARSSRWSLRRPSEVRSGILYATVIIILVFLPLFALSGIEGRLFAPLGIAFIVSILASLVVAMTVTPVLAYWLLPAHAPAWPQREPAGALLKRIQERGLRWCFARPAFTIGLPAVAVLWAAFAAAQLPRAFLPPFNEGTALVNVVLQPGISLKESNRLGAIAERLVMEVPEVHSVGRRTGRAELDEHAEGVHVSELDVDLKPSRRSREAGARRHPRAPLGAAGERDRRPAHRPPARPHALGRARAARAQDLRRRSRHPARPGRGPGEDSSPRSRASSTCRPRSRCASRSCRCASTTIAPSSSA